MGYSIRRVSAVEKRYILCRNDSALSPLSTNQSRILEWGEKQADERTLTE